MLNKKDKMKKYPLDRSDFIDACQKAFDFDELVYLRQLMVNNRPDFEDSKQIAIHNKLYNKLGDYLCDQKTIQMFEQKDKIINKAIEELKNEEK